MPPARLAARPSGASSGVAEERSEDQRGGEADDREAAIARGDRDHRSGNHHRRDRPEDGVHRAARVMARGFVGLRRLPAAYVGVASTPNVSNGQ